MKFIHCADLHLASRLESRFSPDQAHRRRDELFETFRRLADEAVRSEVAAILICGDIFDEGKPRSAAKKRFIEIVSTHPEVDFLCLSGNHDESLAEEEDLPKNLLCFGDEWKKYTYGEVNIWGIEINEWNYNLIYSGFRPDVGKTNVVMLHGQVCEYAAEPSFGTIVLPSLADTGIDYLALGHIHSFRQKQLDSRGVWCYSGCLEGRGYDECGEKGYVLLETDKEGVRSHFVPFSKRTIFEIECCIEGLKGVYEIENRVLESVSHIAPENLVRLKLTGSIDTGVQLRTDALEELLKKRFFHAEVKSAVKPLIRPEDHLDQLSLRGEFVRMVLGADNLPDEEKNRIIRCGFLALMDEEVDEL